MKAVVIDTGFAFQSPNEITSIEYKSGCLEITCQSTDGAQTVRAIFLEVAGFRVLDEGDLLEFWPTCSSAKDWIFQISEGGWFDQERLRAGFIRGDLKEIREYLIGGINDCVSVFSWTPPELRLCTP
jgi:hypothetical protein